jgi:hypothetical protein
MLPCTTEGHEVATVPQATQLLYHSMPLSSTWVDVLGPSCLLPCLHQQLLPPALLLLLLLSCLLHLLPASPLWSGAPSPAALP